MPVCSDEDRDEVQAETRKQEKHLDDISDVLGDLKRLGNVRAPARAHQRTASFALPVKACLVCTSPICPYEHPSLHIGMKRVTPVLL